MNRGSLNITGQPQPQQQQQPEAVQQQRPGGATGQPPLPPGTMARPRPPQLNNTASLTIKTNPIHDDYIITKNVLGLGINGKVLECLSKTTNRKYAIKVSVSPFDFDFHPLTFDLSIRCFVIM